MTRSYRHGQRYSHYWVKKHLKRPELCQICGIKPPHDLKNITGIYDKNFENWKYLCRGCGMTLNGKFHSREYYQTYKDIIKEQSLKY